MARSALLDRLRAGGLLSTPESPSTAGGGTAGNRLANLTKQLGNAQGELVSTSPLSPSSGSTSALQRMRMGTTDISDIGPGRGENAGSTMDDAPVLSPKFGRLGQAGGPEPISPGSSASSRSRAREDPGGASLQPVLKPFAKDMRSDAEKQKDKQAQAQEAEQLIDQLHAQKKQTEAEVQLAQALLDSWNDAIVALRKRIYGLKRTKWVRFFGCPADVIFDQWKIVMERRRNGIALEHMKEKGNDAMRDRAERMMKVVGSMSGTVNVTERCFTAWKMEYLATPMASQMAEQQKELQEMQQTLQERDSRTEQIVQALRQRNEEEKLQQSLVDEELQKQCALEEALKEQEEESERQIALARAEGTLRLKHIGDDAKSDQAYLDSIYARAAAYSSGQGHVNPQSVVLAFARQIMPMAGHTDVNQALNDLRHATGADALRTRELQDVDALRTRPVHEGLAARPSLLPRHFRFKPEHKVYKSALPNEPLAQLLASDPQGIVAALALAEVEIARRPALHAVEPRERSAETALIDDASTLTSPVLTRRPAALEEPPALPAEEAIPPSPQGQADAIIGRLARIQRRSISPYRLRLVARQRSGSPYRDRLHEATPAPPPLEGELIKHRSISPYRLRMVGRQRSAPVLDVPSPVRHGRPERGHYSPALPHPSVVNRPLAPGLPSSPALGYHPQQRSYIGPAYPVNVAPQPGGSPWMGPYPRAAGRIHQRQPPLLPVSLK